MAALDVLVLADLVDDELALTLAEADDPDRTGLLIECLDRKSVV